MSDFWDKRYTEKNYAYGKEPNAYFKKIIDTLPPGKILIPGAGEGRDAVYAAKLGWKVKAFDQSNKGKDKAIALAAEQSVQIEFDVMNVLDFNFDSESFDLVASIFFHLPIDIGKYFLNNVHRSLKQSGHIILEAFTPLQLNNKSGGPSDINFLMTSEILKNELGMFCAIENYESEIFLNEGIFHQGKANTIRYFGFKESH
jgi:2-polyprenyl-3-methyl-5-hydroxy-6-metoxy-1,4-benzoquinol methylase